MTNVYNFWTPSSQILNSRTLFPEAPQVYDSLAFAYLSQGDKKMAKSTFSQSLAINADFESDYVSDNYGHSTTSH